MTHKQEKNWIEKHPEMRAITEIADICYKFAVHVQWCKGKYKHNERSGGSKKELNGTSGDDETQYLGLPWWHSG